MMRGIKELAVQKSGGSTRAVGYRLTFAFGHQDAEGGLVHDFLLATKNVEGCVREPWTHVWGALISTSEVP